MSDIIKLTEEVEIESKHRGCNVKDMIMDAMIPFGRNGESFFSINPSMIAGAACSLTSFEVKHKFINQIDKIINSSSSDEEKVKFIRKLLIEESYNNSRKKIALEQALSKYGINSEKTWVESKGEQEE